MTVLITAGPENVAGNATVLMRVAGLSKRYGDQQALADVSFDVHGNEILGLIGPNGAGKTTLLEAIVGLLPVDNGSVLWRDSALPFNRRRNSIFFLPDGVRPWQEQHVLRVMEFFAAVYRRPDPILANTIRLLDLAPVLRKRVDALSKGFCRRLMLALALLTPHPLLLMDEPFDGFDLRQTREMRSLGHIELPPNRSKGGFDHADIHQGTDRLYVAHTSNDAVDVIDTALDRYLESISGLTAVAGVLVSETRGLVFTSNRGEDTVSVFAPGTERDGFKIAVGVKPNGLAFDSTRGILIAANVGDPSIPNSHSVSVVDVEHREQIAELKVPGRTRWTIYDQTRELFFINIASPARIIVIDARNPTKISREHDVPAAGPHGLARDPATGRLMCACDAGVLLAIDPGSGRVLGDVGLSGPPDVIFLHGRPFGRLYVAVGDPELIDVIDVETMRREEVVATELGAHTLALDRKRNKVYAFLPQSHRAAVFQQVI